MALTIATLTLASGLSLTNPLLVISELNISNNSSESQRLDISTAPGADASAPQAYQLINSQHGGRGCSYLVSVFINQAAFDAGKPPVEQLKDGRATKVFSVNLDDAAYKDLTPRQAAYAHLITQPGFEAAEAVAGLAI